MEKRVSILVVVLVLVAVLGLSVRVVPWLIEPFTEGSKKLEEAKNEFRRRMEEVSRKAELQDQYRALAAKTLSLDAEQAGKALHALLVELAEANRLGKVSVERSIISRIKGSPTTVRVTISGECPLRSLVDFLEAFYRLPYAVSLASLSLTPMSSRGPGGTVMKFSAGVQAMVLHPNPMVGKRPVPTASLNPKERGQGKRLQHEYAVAYAPIYTKDVFSGPVQVVAAPSTPTTRSRFESPRSPTPPRVDPQATTVLIGVAKYPWYDPESGQTAVYQEAVTRNDRTNEKRVVRTGEPFGLSDHAGTLVLVDSSGAVVRTPAREMYFYPLGKPFTESTRLDPNSHPDLYWAVQEQESHP